MSATAVTGGGQLERVEPSRKRPNTIAFELGYHQFILVAFWERNSSLLGSITSRGYNAQAFGVI
jgi:hypothetical protein